VAAQEPSAVQPGGLRPRWLLWALAALLGIGVGVGLALGLRHGSSPAGPAAVEAALGGPAATWPSGAKPAPAFRLHDAAGAPVSLAQYRGRNAIITFVDPRCTTFCPLESAVLNQALRNLPASERPVVIAINVNPPVQAGATLRKEATRFHWLPQWRWATGSKAQLASTWASYGIEVIPTKGDITHTEAAYLVDKNGDQRALFLWPFSANDILRTYRKLG
jgi:cytochrome oxidase Cu insertion factor (SCO1/SenC/PrrC family)